MIDATGGECFCGAKKKTTFITLFTDLVKLGHFMDKVFFLMSSGCSATLIYGVSRWTDGFICCCV